MKIWREGRLTDSQLHTGDILSVQLHTPDIEDLADPSRRYSTTRFMESSNPVPGWAPEDKVHVRLEDPMLPEHSDVLANLWLDPGGDLYFTIWHNERLRHAKGCEEFRSLSELVTNDPKNHLGKVGIKAVRLFYLNFLSMEIQKRNLY